MDAIEKLADVSDGGKLRNELLTLYVYISESSMDIHLTSFVCIPGDSPNRQKQHQHSNEERDWNTQGFRNSAYEQFDRSRNNYGDRFIVNHAERAGIPCIDLQDDDF